MKKIFWPSLFVIFLTLWFFLQGRKADKDDSSPKVETSIIQSSELSLDDSEQNTAPSKLVLSPKIDQQSEKNKVRKLYTQTLQSEDLARFEVLENKAIGYGDIVLGIPETQETQSGLTVLEEGIRLWDLPIPYLIDDNLSSSLKENILKAISDIENVSAVSFKKYEGEKDFIFFQESKEYCLSHLGRVGGVQGIYLAPACTTSSITHELMHALGFIHEHSRIDRNEYIEVLYEHFEEEYDIQFDIVPLLWAETSRDFKYDYQSIMHYPDNAFAKDPELKTLESKTDQKITPTGTLSEGDIERLQFFYK